MRKCSQNSDKGSWGGWAQPLVASAILLILLFAIRILLGVWAGIFLAAAVLIVALFLIFVISWES